VHACFTFGRKYYLNNTLKETIQIKGMTCTNCALSVEKQLVKSGLKHVEVNFIRGEANFENEEKIPISILSKDLRAIGYEVVSADSPNAGARSFGLKQKLLLSAIFSAPLLLHMVLPHENLLHQPWIQFALALPVYLIGFFHFGKSAWGSLKGGVPNMDVLIFIGSSAAFFYSLIGTTLYPNAAHEYLFYETAATIITLVLLGNFIEEKAVAKTGESTKALHDMQPTEVSAFIDGIWKSVSTQSIKIGDLIRVRQGDYVPVDGLVEEKRATLDMRFLTGE
jgi:Cu+-exporting ATPase